MSKYATSLSQGRSDGPRNLDLVPGVTEEMEDIAIVLMGLTGSGKSTFISLLTDSSVPIGHTLESCTNKAGIYSFQFDTRRTVHLIDTPGFDDTNTSDTEVLKEISYFLDVLYRERVKLAGMVFLHRITDFKMSGSALRNLHVFQKICGESAYPNTVLATTMWGSLPSSQEACAIGDAREADLIRKDEFWGYMQRKGSLVVRHTGDVVSARKIVSHLVNKSNNVVLDIQQEMVDELQTLDETSAGRFLQSELLGDRRRYEKQLSELEESLREATADNDQEMITILTEQRREQAGMLSKADADQMNMKVSFQQLAQQRNKNFKALTDRMEKERIRSEVEIAACTEEIQELRQQMAKLQDNIERGRAERTQNLRRALREQKARSKEERKYAEIAMQEQRQNSEDQRRMIEALLAQKERKMNEYKRRLPSIPKILKQLFSDDSDEPFQVTQVTQSTELHGDRRVFTQRRASFSQHLQDPKYSPNRPGYPDLRDWSNLRYYAS